MVQLLCPFCSQVYTDGVHLAAHVHRTHRDAAGPLERALAVSMAQTVTDVAVTSPAIVEPQNETSCVCELPTAQDRADLAAALAENTERLAVVRADMRELRQRLDGIESVLGRTESALNSPDTVRRATLSAVLDKLLDAGHMSAYSLVSQMLRDAS